MSKAVIGLLILVFSFIFLLRVWVILLTVALLLFSRGKKGPDLRPEIEGD
jgi:hypothetical protein